MGSATDSASRSQNARLVETDTVRSLPSPISHSASETESPRIATSGDIAKTVASFYEHISNKNYPAAYALMSSAFHSSTSYEAFKKGYEPTVRVDVANVAPRNDGTGNVDVTLNAVDQKDGSILRRRFVGYLHVIPGNDLSSWRLDGGKFAPPQSTSEGTSDQGGTNSQPSLGITDASAAVAFVKEYYRLWNAREYRTMYSMLSAKMETKYPYDDYVTYHDYVRTIDVDASPSADPALVNVRITSTNLEKDGSLSQAIHEGQWRLIGDNERMVLDGEDVHEIR